MSEHPCGTSSSTATSASASLETNNTPTTPTPTSRAAEPTSAQSSAIAYLSTLLDRPLRLTAIDGRTFIGPLICVDKSSNVVLSPAEEFPAPVPPADTEAWPARRRHDALWPKSEAFDGPALGWGGRPLSMILLEGDKIVKVEVMDEPGARGQGEADRYT